MFRTIPEFPNYMASNVGGEIKGKPGGRRSSMPLKHTLSHGYHYVGLYRDGKIWRVRVHRLVLSAWKGPCPAGLDGLHRDDNKDHNDLSNLYWGTPTQNSADALRNGRNSWANKTICAQGHEYTEENTYRRPGKTGRSCRQCMLDNNRKIKGVKNPRGRYFGHGGEYV